MKFAGGIIDLDTFTIGELRELQSLIAALLPAVPTSPSHAYKLGANYMLRTITMIDTGRLVQVTDQELVIEDAAWIADTGRFSDTLKSFDFNEIEPFPDGRVIVGRGALIYACELARSPRTQK